MFKIFSEIIIITNLTQRKLCFEIKYNGINLVLLEHTKHSWCFGLQWHPEFLITDADIAIIKDFINHA